MSDADHLVAAYIAGHGVTDDSDWEYEIARIVLIAALSAV